MFGNLFLEIYTEFLSYDYLTISNRSYFAFTVYCYDARKKKY